MAHEEKPARVRPNMQGYVERLRRQSRRYSEQLFAGLERLREVTRSLEREESPARTEGDLGSADPARLRDEILHLSDENARLQTELQRAGERLASFAAERESLRRRLAEIEAESSRYAMQYLEVEQQNTMLASLYVTIHQLHATLDRAEVLGGIKEVIINLVGSEELAVFERTASGLRLAESFGVDDETFAVWPLDRGGAIARAVNENEIVVRGEDTPLAGGEEHLTACVPLRRGGEVTGAIAVFRLLQQKPALELVDHELFDLLALHAGMALYTTALHAGAQEPM